MTRVKFHFFANLTSILRMIGVWYDEDTNYSIYILFISVHLVMAVTLVVLEWVFVLTTADYMERAKSISAATYHSLCVIKILNSLRVNRDSRDALKLLTRTSLIFENSYFEQKKNNDQIKKIKKVANRNSFFILTTFLSVAGSSIFFSYLNALAKTYSEDDVLRNVTIIVGELPYNHYHLLDLSTKTHFLIEMFGQAYIITYLTLSFLCRFRFLRFQLIQTVFQVQTIFF